MSDIRERRFDDIYQNTKSSGCGSFKENTVFFNKLLRDFVKENSITSVLDLGCGNFESMEDLVMDLHIDYTGGDISQVIVDYNKEKYNDIKFMKLDALTSDLSGFNQDLIIFRHILQHLNYENSQLAIKNIFSSKCKYVLINHQDGLSINEDRHIHEVDWQNQMYNLNIEPFNLKNYEILKIKDIDNHVVDDGQNECYSFYKIKNLVGYQ